MITVDTITDEFFVRHWHDDFGERPKWSDPWPVNGQGPIPQGELQGCYSLYIGDKLTYIGLGASQGGGLYAGYGIGKRLYSHVLRVNKEMGVSNGKGFYMARDRWRDVTHLRTIGFPLGFGYLAPALELFLIHRASDAIELTNKVKPGSTT